MECSINSEMYQLLLRILCRQSTNRKRFARFRSADLPHPAGLQVQLTSIVNAVLSQKNVIKNIVCNAVIRSTLLDLGIDVQLISC